MDPGQRTGRPPSEEHPATYVHHDVSRTVQPGEKAWERTAPLTGDRRRPANLGLSLESVAGQQPWIRCATPERKREWARTVASARQTSHDRKARVKAHPDLAERLTRALGYKRFDQWTGYVPPARDSVEAVNTSPVRRELMEILRLVAERDAAAVAEQEAA